MGWRLTKLNGFFVSVEGNALPDIHVVDNQLHPEQEAQPQDHQPAAQAHQDTFQEQNQQTKDMSQQTHQDLPPGHQGAP